MPTTSHNAFFLRWTTKSTSVSELRSPRGDTRLLSGPEANLRGIKKFIKTSLKSSSAKQLNARKVTNAWLKILKMTSRSRTVGTFDTGSKKALMTQISLDNASSVLTMPVRTTMSQLTTQVNPFRRKRQKFLSELQKSDLPSKSWGQSSHSACFLLDHYHTSALRKRSSTAVWSSKVRSYQSATDRSHWGSLVSQLRMRRAGDPRSEQI